MDAKIEDELVALARATAEAMGFTKGDDDEEAAAGLIMNALREAYRLGHEAGEAEADEAERL